MKRFIWPVVVIVVLYLLAMQMSKGNSPAQALNIMSSRAQVTPVAKQTKTPVPTATIGYDATYAVLEQTNVAAQATADEARRVNVMVTAGYEQRAQDQLVMTAQYEQRVQEIYSWTVTAALTSVPLTATQQAALNTQIPMQATLKSAQITSTYAAPTQEVAMQQAINYRKYGAVDYFARWFFMLAVGTFFIGLLAWMIRNPVVRQQTPAEQPKSFTVNYVKRENGAYKQNNFNVPCSPEQLTELAELAANGEKRFGINRIEETSRTFKNQRDTLLSVREFLKSNNFVIEDEDGRIALNADGEGFLMDWFEDHKLRDGYNFVEGEKDQAEVEHA